MKKLGLIALLGLFFINWAGGWSNGAITGSVGDTLTLKELTVQDSLYVPLWSSAPVTGTPGLFGADSTNDSLFLYLPSGKATIYPVASAATYWTLRGTSALLPIASIDTLDFSATSQVIFPPGDMQFNVVRPDSDDFGSIGTSSFRYANAYINNITAGVNVETLTTDKTLSPATDAMYQYLEPGGADRIITLDTSTAVIGDRFIIRNMVGHADSTHLIIEQGIDTLGILYTQTTESFIFDGADWTPIHTGDGRVSCIGIGYGTNDAANGVAIGYGASAFNGGVAISSVTKAYDHGVAIGYQSNAYTYGVGIGYQAVGNSYSVAVGSGADASTGGGYGVAIGYGAIGNANNGCAVGMDANGSNNGAALGRGSNGKDYGAAVGKSALGYTSGAALGFGANGTSYGVGIGNDADGHDYGVAIGYNTGGWSNGVAVGNGATGDYGVAVGQNAIASGSGVAVGRGTNARWKGTIIGHYAGNSLNTQYAMNSTYPNKNVLIGYQAGINLTQPSTWAASHAYSLGEYCRPTTINGYNYEVIIAGTSGSSQPTWPTTLGATVVDGGVTWECVSMRGNNNIIIGFDIEASANTADTLIIGNLIEGNTQTKDAGIDGLFYAAIGYPGTADTVIINGVKCTPKRAGAMYIDTTGGDTLKVYLNGAWVAK